jgi:hypothetical protein
MTSGAGFVIGSQGRGRVMVVLKATGDPSYVPQLTIQLSDEITLDFKPDGCSEWYGDSGSFAPALVCHLRGPIKKDHPVSDNI